MKTFWQLRESNPKGTIATFDGKRGEIKIYKKGSSYTGDTGDMDFSAKNIADLKDKLRRLGANPNRPSTGNLKEGIREAYKGNLSDFKKDVELAVDNMGINTKAIKKVSKKGKGYQAYLSSYMDKDSHEKIAKDVGATLKDFKKDSRGTVGIYEADDKDPGEYDEEGVMMKDQLDIVMDAADEIYDMVDDNENLPEWCQNKITKAADYIDSVRDYLMSQKTDKSDD